MKSTNDRGGEGVPNSDLMTLKDAVAFLESKVSLSLLYEAIASNRLPHYRVSGTGRRGKILVRQADVLAWLERMKVAGGAVEWDVPADFPAGEAPPVILTIADAAGQEAFHSFTLVVADK